MNSHVTSSKNDKLREQIFDYPNYFSTEDENSHWKRSTSDASFFLDGKQLTDEHDTSGSVSEQARVYWNLPEAVEASVTPNFGSDRSKCSYEVRRLEKLSTGSATSRVQVHRVHFQEHNLPSIIRKDGANRSQSTPFSPFQNMDSTRLLEQFKEQQQHQDYNLDSTRLLSVHHHSKSDTNQSISSSSKFILKSTDHQSDLANNDSVIIDNKAVKKEYIKESTTSSSSTLSSTLNNRFDSYLNHVDNNLCNKIINDINSKSHDNFKMIEQKMMSEMEKLRLISLSPSTVSSSSLSNISQLLDNTDTIIKTTTPLLQNNNSVLVRNEKDMSRLNEEYKTITNCEYWLTKARQACENQFDLNILTDDLIKPDGLLETVASRLIKPVESISEEPNFDISQNTHEQDSHKEGSKTSELLTESTDKVDGKPLKLLTDTTPDLDLVKTSQYNEANRRVVIGSARLLSQILSENHLLNILDEKLISQKHPNFLCKDEFNKIDKLIIRKQESAPCTSTSPTYDNDYEKSIDTTSTTKLSSPAILSSTQKSPLSDNQLPSNGHITELLKNIIGKCWEYREDVDIYREYLGILEPLLKHTETMCDTVVENGGLRSLIYACRSSDLPSLRQTAVCLMNLAVFGGSGSHSEMMRQHAIEWLFCLAFHQDEVIKYFACLTSAVLSTNPELVAAVNASCTLDLVMPFVRSHSPIEFARQNLVAAFQHSCKNNVSDTSEPQKSLSSNPSDLSKYCCENQYTGGSADWLKRLIPVMFSKQFEPRVLVAFHFAVEATLKSDMNCSQAFYESEIVEILRNVVCSSTFLESKFAAMALHILGENVPSRLPAQVPLWDYAEVECWLIRRGFEDLAAKFSELRVDGDLLLKLDEFKLEKDLGLVNGITRSRLLRELCSLKINADYSAVDPTGISTWLREATRITALNNINTPINVNTSDYSMIENDFQWTTASNSKYCYTHDLSCLNQSFDLLQYAYNFISAGVHYPFLPYLSDKMLLEDCRIKNGIHRKRILEAIQSSISSQNQLRLTDKDSKLNTLSHLNKYIDIFISYRRSTGSQLASLLKVHFHLRGYRVFLDIDRLTAGKFHESLLHSIKSSYNFVLVLTSRALDRCINDTHCTDWIHKELVCALESGCNIIPITDNFTWPSADSLPEDIRSITTYNAVNWIHDYQEACIDKVEKFMIKPITSTPLPCNQIKPFNH